MSREALQESLSALLDNETDELELRRVLTAGAADAEVRATWARYQVARAVMHKDLLEPRLDLAAAVSAALAAEQAPAKLARLPWRGLGRLAVAASVTVAVLAGVRLYNQDEITSTQLAQRDGQPSLISPQLQGPAILAGYSPNAGAAAASQAGARVPGQLSWQQQHLPGYVRQHAQQAALIGTESALPYARAASLESR